MKFVSPHAALLAASQPARLGRKDTMASLMLAAARKVKAGQAAERNAWANRAGAGKTHFAAFRACTQMRKLSLTAYGV